MDRFEKSALFLGRLEKFADNINLLCKSIRFGSVTSEIISQLVRSGSSPAANYIEAIESLSKKDFYFRIRICRKESREAGYWLRRLKVVCPDIEERCDVLESESREFVLIFSKILSKYSNS